MEIISQAYLDKVKRYWRRRRYQRLYRETDKKRKLKVIRLGGEATQTRRRLWKLKSPKQKLQWKHFSPIRFFENFHDAYVEMMIKLASNMGKLNNYKGISSAKNKEIVVLSCGEEVDAGLVLQIYKRLAASHDLRES